MATLDGVVQAPGGLTRAQLSTPQFLESAAKTYRTFRPAVRQNNIQDLGKVLAFTYRFLADSHATVFLNNLEAVRKPTDSDGSTCKSGAAANSFSRFSRMALLEELWLLFLPADTCKGKKWFTDGAIPVAFALKESVVTPSGLTIATLHAREK